MHQVASRELRNNTAKLLRLVEDGETVRITVQGRPVADLVPVGRKPRFVAWESFAAALENAAADRGLLDELRELLPDTTDDIRIWDRP